MDQSKIPGYERIKGATPRETEGKALAEIARRLYEAQRSGSEEDILAAVRLNLRLWTIFQAELSEPDCPVPVEIRQNILSLSVFIDRHTADLLFRADPRKLDILISINRHIAAGLLTTPPEEAGEHVENNERLPQDTLQEDSSEFTPTDV